MTGNRMLLLLPALLLGVMLESAQAQAPRTAPRPAGAGMKTVLPLPDTQDFERDRQTLVYLQKIVERIIQALSLDAEARRRFLIGRWREEKGTTGRNRDPYASSVSVHRMEAESIDAYGRRVRATMGQARTRFRSAASRAGAGRKEQGANNGVHGRLASSPP